MFYEGNCEFMENKMTYKDAGVDIEAGNRAVNMIKGSVKSTYRPEVIGELGGWRAFRPKRPKVRKPGVGFGRRRRRHETEIGFYGR